jgi:hypothetical protein
MITSRYYIKKFTENNAVGLDAASSWLPKWRCNRDIQLYHNCRMYSLVNCLFVGDGGGGGVQDSRHSLKPFSNPCLKYTKHDHC